MPKSKNRRKSRRPGDDTAREGARTGTSTSASAAGATISAEATERTKKQSVGPVKFFQQVRDEMRKVTWTSRNETIVSTIMVMIMVALASVFFFAIDQVLRWIVPMILNINA